MLVVGAQVLAIYSGRHIMEIIKYLAKLIPIIRDGPTWLQVSFALALLFAAQFVVSLLIYLVGRSASVDQFTIDLPREGQYVPGREIALEGRGLPISDRLSIEVSRLESGQRIDVPQTDANPDHKPDQTWRYEHVRFTDPGDHDIVARVIRAGKAITYTGPIRVHVGEWVKAPQFSGTRPVVRANPTKDYPADLSEYVARIYDQGPEGSNAAFAAITSMEIAFAVAGTHRSLSARYVYDKATNTEHKSFPLEGTFMTSIATSSRISGQCQPRYGRTYQAIMASHLA